MKDFIELLAKTETDMSDENFTKLISESEKYIYDEKDVDNCNNIYAQLCAFGYKMVRQKKYYHSYCMYRLSLRFASKTDWERWQVALLLTSYSMVEMFPARAQVQGFELITAIVGFNKIATVGHPNFLRDLFHLATLYGKNMDKPGCENYKACAILLMEQVVKFGASTNFDKLADATFSLNQLKTGVDFSVLLTIAEYNSTEENILAMVAGNANPVYDPAKADFSANAYQRLDYLGRRLYQMSNFKLSQLVHHAALAHISPSEIQSGLNTLLNILGTGIYADHSIAISAITKLQQAVHINFANIETPPFLYLDDLFFAANYFANSYNQNKSAKKYQMAALSLCKTMKQLQQKYSGTEPYPKAKECDVLCKKIRDDLAKAIPKLLDQGSLRKLSIFHNTLGKPIIPVRSQSEPIRRPAAV